MEDRLSEEQRGKMLQFMTTEHSALQAGRSATIFETGGRTAVFLGTVSSTLIALAFVGQISGLGTAFFAFALVLLPTLFFLGLATFERTMQLQVEDYIYAVGMSRIRHLFVETVALSVGVGIAAFVVSVLLQRRHQIARWHQIEERLPTLFPSEPNP